MLIVTQLSKKAAILKRIRSSHESYKLGAQIVHSLAA